MAQRVTFYIDGFNFYYGLRRTKCNEPQWGDYYWIDMVKLCGIMGSVTVLTESPSCGSFFYNKVEYRATFRK